jgi:hypothetical protein
MPKRRSTVGHRESHWRGRHTGPVWMRCLCAIIILVGTGLNADMEHRTARDTTRPAVRRTRSPRLDCR